tara:strand:- start:95 stop:469 length:375 start_codon:yes stop_codon:yes gene_type:complete
MTKTEMLRILVLLIPGIVYGCATIVDTTDPTLGKWNYELFNLPYGEPKGVLIIEAKADSHKITMRSPANTFNLTEVEIIGNRLVRGYFRSGGYNIKVSGTFEEDYFDGQIDAEGNIFRMTADRE